MATSDLAINVRIRKILASHWIDLRALQFRAYRGTVRLTGQLKRMNGISTEILPIPVPAIEQEIRRIDGVKSVFFELDNFTRNLEGSWVEVKKD